MTASGRTRSETMFTRTQSRDRALAAKGSIASSVIRSAPVSIASTASSFTIRKTLTVIPPDTCWFAEPPVLRACSFAAWLLAEHLGLSGVVTLVVLGLTLARRRRGNLVAIEALFPHPRWRSASTTVAKAADCCRRLG